jgi:hypothetical protein
MDRKSEADKNAISYLCGVAPEQLETPLHAPVSSLLLHTVFQHHATHSLCLPLQSAHAKCGCCSTTRPKCGQLSKSPAQKTKPGTTFVVLRSFEKSTGVFKGLERTVWYACFEDHQTSQDRQP